MKKEKKKKKNEKKEEEKNRTKTNKLRSSRRLVVFLCLLSTRFSTLSLCAFLKQMVRLKIQNVAEGNKKERDGVGMGTADSGVALYAPH